MTSASVEQAASPAPLKNKLSQVKYLLDNADKRLQEEAAKYEVFTIKTSTPNSSSTSGANNVNNPAKINGPGSKDVPNDITRTISDINTLRSVLSCPIFNRIVNVTDSLDKLSYHLYLHPSIGPSDINIDANGELILAPPIEPSALNNIINSRLDELSDNSNISPHILSPDYAHSNNNLSSEQQHQMRLHRNPPAYNRAIDNGNNHGLSSVPMEQTMDSNDQQFEEQIARPNAFAKDQTPFKPQVPQIAAAMRSYNSEKLVTKGNERNLLNGNYQRNQNANTGFSKNLGEIVSGCLYKDNGHFTLDQTADPESRFNFEQRAQSVDQITDQSSYEGRKIGYSNEMYNTADELSRNDAMAIRQDRVQSNGQNNTYGNNGQGLSVSNGVKAHQHMQATGVQYNRGSCSPSTSVGSTVRLADECDSGASSYQSQTQKSIPCSTTHHPQKQHPQPPPQPIQQLQQQNRVTLDTSSDSVSGNRDQEALISSSSDGPEIERIKVTLEKDNDGIGITIAGYKVNPEPYCENGISGIFIKAITPGSPADRSGKVRALDQIFAVNGRELLNYSNQEGVEVLRKTGKIVTLELIRRSSESSYKKLKNTLAEVPLPRTGSTSTETNVTNETAPTSQMQAQPSAVAVERASVAQVSHDTSGSTSSGGRQHDEEAIYKNSSVLKGPLNDVYYNQSSHNHSVAPRGGANKVIETKQGARNTIEIKSPAYRGSPADYNEQNNGAVLGTRSQLEANEDFTQYGVPEWEHEARIVKLDKEGAHGLGFAVKKYANPKDLKSSIIMITSITQGGIAERSGELSIGDLLIFVDDTDLEGASLEETEKALKKTSGKVRLGILKLKREF